MALGDRAIWRRFVGDVLLTIGVGIVLGIVYFLYVQATSGPGSLHPYYGYHDPVRAAIGIGVGLLVMRAIGRLISGYLRSQGDQRHDAMVRLFVNLLVAVVILFYLASVEGVSLQSLFLGSALAGVVLGLASQTVLGNVFAGITIVMWGPFRSGERIGVISASYGAIASTYAHEASYPMYIGTVTDIGLLYTVLRLDNGRVAKVPNVAILQGLVVNLSQSPVRNLRIRMTFPQSVPVATVEAAVATLPGTSAPVVPDRPPPFLEVADVGPATWDGVVVLWSAEPDEDRVRDVVLRAVLARTAVPPPPKP